MGIDINRFRFRAWNKSFRRMIYDIFFFWKENKITMYELKEDGSKYYLPNSHIVLEQCTGIKDKNGKLIYEGDIISFNEIKECGTVVWDKNNLLWRYCGENEKTYVQPLGDLDMDYWQVVGNIHENVELLRGAQWQ